MHWHLIKNFCVAAVCALLAQAVIAATAYPIRTVRMIVPFAAAGGSDIMARSLAKSISESTGQQFVVENRPGANALLGTEAVAKAAPDGYTLLLTTNIFTINPWLYPNVPFNVERDFAPITLAGSTPNLLVVHPAVPVKSLKELITFAKSRPGQLTIAAAGLGTPSHLAAELLRQSAKIDLLVVQYKGTGSSLNDLIGGQTAPPFQFGREAHSLEQFHDEEGQIRRPVNTGVGDLDDVLALHPRGRLRFVEQRLDQEGVR